LRTGELKVEGSSPILLVARREEERRGMLWEENFKKKSIGKEKEQHFREGGRDLAEEAPRKRSISVSTEKRSLWGKVSGHLKC